MRAIYSSFKVAQMVALTIYLLGCQTTPSYVTGYEYLELKGFAQPLFGQILHEGTVKNVNKQIPEILLALQDSVIVQERPIDPTFRIHFEIGSSFRSQMVSIEIGEDGYGLMQHLNERVFIHCAKLSVIAKSAFDQSAIIVR
jgi:hypothetical protein